MQYLDAYVLLGCLHMLGCLFEECATCLFILCIHLIHVFDWYWESPVCRLAILLYMIVSSI